LYITKALIVRGDQLGYQTIQSLFSQQNAAANFHEAFARIVLKKAPAYICRENGFPQLNKMHTQRLFTMLFPVVQKEGNHQLMMQLCGIVTLQMLETQNRLQELIPIAQQALASEQDTSFTDLEVKLTALALFRKIFIQAAASDAAMEQKAIALGYLRTFIPSILKQMGREPPAQQVKPDHNIIQLDIKLKVESLYTLTLLCEKYPSAELHKYDRKVRPVLTQLLDHKKRVVRKFTRTCLNDWHMK